MSGDLCRLRALRVLALVPLLFARTPSADPFPSNHERLFYEALHRQDAAQASDHFREILRTPKKFQYLDEYHAADLRLYLDTLSCKTPRPDLTHSIAFVFVEEIDATFQQPHKGKTVPVHVRGRYSEAAAAAARPSVDLFSRFYACSPDFKIAFSPQYVRHQDIKLTEIRTVPFREKGQIALNLPVLANSEAKAFVKSRLDDFDLFVFVIPSEQKGLSTASLMTFKDAAGRSVRRGVVVIGTERIRVTQTLIHEVFHILEQASGNSAYHLYETKQKQNWPPWYFGGGQLTYYRGFLKALKDRNETAKLRLRQ